MPCVLDDVGEPCLPRLLHTRLHGERAVERYTASPPPTTPLQSSTALYSLYSFIQRCIKIVYYTAIQPIQYTALYNHPLMNIRVYLLTEVATFVN